MRGKMALLFCLSALLLALMAMPAQAGVTEGAPLMFVNKEHSLAEDYEPTDMVNLNQYISAGGDVLMVQSAAEALSRMTDAMYEDGAGIVYGASGFRSYYVQTILSQRKINEYSNWQTSLAEATELANQVVAPPGSSEHQTGLAIDLTSSENGYAMESSFADTKGGRWLAEHCAEYGFILRYGADKTRQTGYIYEPWHFRYIGAPHAAYLTAHNLCLEEYIDRLKQGCVYIEAGSNAWLVYYVENLQAAEDLPWSDITFSRLLPDSSDGLAVAMLTPQERFAHKEALAAQQIDEMLRRSVYDWAVFTVPWLGWDGLRTQPLVSA